MDILMNRYVRYASSVSIHQYDSVRQFHPVPTDTLSGDLHFKVVSPTVSPEPSSVHYFVSILP